jgi:hypothetical protein
MKRLHSRPTVFLFLAALLLAWAPLSFGQSAGFDLLQTAPGAKVDLTKMGLGVVPLKGVPIEACTGNTDTIMRRTKDSPPAGGTVPLEVYAVFMKSTHPIKFKGQSADVYVTINNSGGTISTTVVPQPDTLSPSAGTMDVHKNHTFDSKIEVLADLIFVKAGKGPASTADILDHQPASPITLTAPGSTWSSKPFPGYPKCQQFPSGGFYAKPKHRGPHPVNPGTRTRPPQPPPKPPQGA